MPAEKSTQKSKKKNDEGLLLPEKEEALSSFAPALSQRLSVSRERLARIAAKEPQLLHIEGGTADERFSTALWYAALLNCQHQDGASPCLACAECMQIGACLHSDIFLLDGRRESIKIDDVRSLRPLMGERPHFLRKRVIILAEAQAMGVEAANSLLKILEEPSPDTCFLFTVPQRERLLPTLISRGWVFTLPWPVPSDTADDSEVGYAQAIGDFLATGRGWLDQTAMRNTLDSQSAQKFLLAGQNALAAAMRGTARTPLEAEFARLSDSGRISACELFAEAQDALQAQVSVLLVLDRTMMALFGLIHAQPPRT